MPAPRGNFLGWTLAASAALLLVGALSIGNFVGSKNPTARSALARPAAPTIPAEMKVVIYGDGKTFHTPQCTFIHDRNQARTMTASEALREGFTPCVRCMRQYLGRTALYSIQHYEAEASLQWNWTFPGSIGNRWFDEHSPFANEAGAGE
jgi:hypothetical protein